MNFRGATLAGLTFNALADAASFRRFENSRNMEVPPGTRMNPFWPVLQTRVFSSPCLRVSLSAGPTSTRFPLRLPPHARLHSLGLVLALPPPNHVKSSAKFFLPE